MQTFTVGAEMEGGSITVKGSTETYPGREMKGGILEIMGNVKETVEPRTLVNGEV